MASEEMSFENVDDDANADDRQRMPAYTISSPTQVKMQYFNLHFLSHNSFKDIISYDVNKYVCWIER